MTGPSNVIDVDDLADEVANVRAVDMLQERGICCKVFRRYRSKLAACFAEVFGEEIVQLGVVAQRLRKVLESGNNLIDRAFSGPEQRCQLWFATQRLES